MGMKKLGLLLLLVIVGGYYYYTRPREQVHYHAGFTVYVEGVKQDYSDYKYMNFRPCTEEETKKTKKDEQIEKAHLHDGVGDVVHVEHVGAKWGDLFKNIGVELAEKPDILQQEIVPNSSVVITIGKEVANPEYVTLEHIKEVEAKSELCGSD